ncbi:putative disease resistance protein RGA1 [Neltuma alba]|uniref:putative disease resistance protein RGA1 n=1 Tax=Neltuma alba TaxID=207710 RepID=UPI0010A38C92|nr:putative disease resistance protein RGA1 [Prosopis alba]
MDAIAGNVFQGLTSLALEEFKLLWNAKHDAESMKNTILAIRATLLDAEAKANNNHQVSFWLARLKDVLYDADDLLDDLSTEALRRGIMTPNSVAKKVRIFFSKSNQVVYSLKMAHKLREVRGRLDEIDNDKKQFHLIDHPVKPLPVLEQRKQTYSFVQEDEITGREEEKDLILRCLLDSNVKSSVSVIPIVGFGGLGKTTLAQLVYNHVHVQKYFGLKRWICVSDEFDVRRIALKILGQESQKEMEQVQQDFRQLIEGKKFFIVLDDVWNEDVEIWHKLKCLLTMGVKGSMIIVTTRSEKVGKMMGTYPPIILKGLDGERSWKLFCRVAFEGGRESNDQELVEIGKEVVKKCAGVPLAIRVVGSLVYDKTLEGIDLSYLKNCELWNIEQLEERIFAVLKLSYDHLPSAMKNCVAFCSLFPKDFEFKKQTLIQMWVAEGFIQLTNKMRCEEDVGNEYFMNLLSRSFFQGATRDDYGDINACKMHDLIHDLAHFVAKDDYLLIKEEKTESSKDATRHLSYDVPRRVWRVPTSLLKFEKLRTMLLLAHIFPCRMDHSLFYLVASKLKFIRVLGLRRSNITEIPESIGKLKYLRFLDLSANHFKQVPRTITRLHNLQTLNLSSNAGLRELPRGINKLDMRRRRASARISELGELNNLRGTLKIRGLKHLRSNPTEAESARLMEKQHLQELFLSWDTFSSNCELSKDNSDEFILERLRPHHAIKFLCIDGFSGERLPDWIGTLLKLQHLRLWNCRNLISLPEGLRHLRSLRTFKINGTPLLDRRCQHKSGDEWQEIARNASILFARNIRILTTPASR